MLISGCAIHKGWGESNNELSGLINGIDYCGKVKIYTPSNKVWESELLK